MRDVDPKSNEETPYECFECGTLTVAVNNPGKCPDCDGLMRNRRMPIE